MDDTLALWNELHKERMATWQGLLIALDNLQESTSQVAELMRKEVRILQGRIALQDLVLEEEAAALKKLAEAEQN
jgi:hypothetical protein